MIENKSSVNLEYNQVPTNILTPKKWVSPQIEEWTTESMGLKAGGPFVDGALKTYLD